jgi:hypothetical protein
MSSYPSSPCNGARIGFPFARKVRSFKERFFLVRPRSVAALNNLLEVAKDGVQDCLPFFHLCWSQEHFVFEPRDFGQTMANLTDEERLCFILVFGRQTLITFEPF